MEKESGVVHFRIGDNFGVTLMQIAHEKMFHNLEPQKALETITQSLHGCPMDLAKAVIKGDMLITVNEESQDCSIKPIGDVKDTSTYGYIINEFDLPSWYKKKHYEIRDNGSALHKAIERLKNDIAVNTRTFGGIELTIPYKELFNFVGGNNDPLLEYLREQEKIEEIFDLIVLIKNYLETTFKLYNVFKSLQNWYPELFELGAEKYLLTEKWVIVDTVQRSFTNLLNQDFDSIIEEVKAEDEGLANYLESARQIDETLSSTIQPVNITDGYNAGWLAPDGTYYGLNGEIANMLHNNIATALYEAKIIPNNEDNEGNPDMWLNNNGWVRQHNDWILFEGYYNERLDKDNVPMTEKQIKALYEFGQFCCGGSLKFGIQKQQISAVMFQDIEPLMLKKLFSF
jgi:hypothetical protein